jgi:uncharacterized protein (TIGR02444 family)
MENTDSLWNFSVTIYRQPGVSHACLSLQDRLGLDVNVLLFCCWFGCTRGPLDCQTFNNALDFSKPWAEKVVHPLRAARIWMKVNNCVQPLSQKLLREKIKTVELEAEHLQQGFLENLSLKKSAKSVEPELQLKNIALNLQRYLKHCNVHLDDPSLSELAHIVTAAITNIEKTVVLKTFDISFQDT